MSLQMPIAVQATAHHGIRRLTRIRYRYFSYALRFADGREIFGLGWAEADKLLQGHRYPADASCTRHGAERHCPDLGAGAWVDYPYGRPLDGQ
ncbi:hypothetical protein [Glutamicibacter sp.]|uniref:hypothetical protein n=1 Tax=Glutamicibacter sp. TaxID=1931995 RepID=UPI003D6AD7F1